VWIATNTCMVTVGCTYRRATQAHQPLAGAVNAVNASWAALSLYPARISDHSREGLEILQSSITSGMTDAPCFFGFHFLSRRAKPYYHDLPLCIDVLTTVGLTAPRKSLRRRTRNTSCSSSRPPSPPALHHPSTLRISSCNTRLKKTRAPRNRAPQTQLRD
jgi:hypothetical protein